MYEARDAASLERALAACLADDKPCFCEVFVDRAQGFSPKLASRRLEDGTMVSPSLEDMAPFLPRDELSAVMAELLEIK